MSYSIKVGGLFYTAPCCAWVASFDVARLLSSVLTQSALDDWGLYSLSPSKNAVQTGREERRNVYLNSGALAFCGQDERSSGPQRRFVKISLIPSAKIPELQPVQGRATCCPHGPLDHPLQPSLFLLSLSFWYHLVSSPNHDLWQARTCPAVSTPAWTLSTAVTSQACHSAHHNCSSSACTKPSPLCITCQELLKLPSGSEKAPSF